MKVLHAVDAAFDLEKSPVRKPNTGRKVTPPAEQIQRVLGGVLDHNHTLIHNVNLEGGAIQAPIAVVGLSGVTLVYLDQRRGVYRAKGDEWEQLDERRNQYRAVSPNPLQAAKAQADRLRAYLSEQGFAQVIVQAVIVFTETGIHIDSEPGEVRLIYLEGFPRFAAGLGRAQPTLTVDEVRALVPILAPYTLEEALASREIQDEFSFREEKPPQVQIPQIEVPLPSDEKLVRAIHKVPFSKRQLVIIGILVVLNLLVLIALVLVVLALS